MNSRWMRMAVAAVAALAIPGCAQEGTEGAQLEPGETLQIGSEVWADYQAYVQRGRGLEPDRQGAFAVVVAGNLGLAGFYSYRTARSSMTVTGRAARPRSATCWIPAGPRISAA